VLRRAGGRAASHVGKPSSRVDAAYAAKPTGAGRASGHHVLRPPCRRLPPTKARPDGSALQAVVLTPKGDGILAADRAGLLTQWRVDNPHPEVTLKTVFGKVWYEGYSEPAWVWQSTGGTDDFEAKLSLTPLIYGTLKGTFYALLFAVPLALLAAIYVSEFMHPNVKVYVKPVVEIMAALPSVVLGFLAGLWLAPMVERVVPGLFLTPFVVAPCILAAFGLWRMVPGTVRGRIRPGTELALLVPVVLVGVWLAMALGGVVEQTLLGGSYRGWLLSALGLTYDQRNSLVVGVAMGFAGDPDHLHDRRGLPRQRTAAPPGRLAGPGRHRWQTAIRIVLPTASPGIFSAMMIGFGRAVGETMIVLMATGNTPVMDWSIFNGFRALSANIAVELPRRRRAERSSGSLPGGVPALLLDLRGEHTGRSGAAQAAPEVPLPVSPAGAASLAQRRALHLADRRSPGARAACLVAGFLGLIVVNGFGFFWPQDVVRAHAHRRQDAHRTVGRARGDPGEGRSAAIKLQDRQPRPLRRRLPVGGRDRDRAARVLDRRRRD